MDPCKIAPCKIAPCKMVPCKMDPSKMDPCEIVLNSSFKDFWCTNINNHLICLKKKR